VLADLTGISISTAERWSQWAKQDWAAYSDNVRPTTVRGSTARNIPSNLLNILTGTNIRSFSMLIGRFLAQLR
jgi:hypothetical protein